MSADLSGGKRLTVPTFTLFLRQACLTGGFPLHYISEGQIVLFTASH